MTGRLLNRCRQVPRECVLKIVEAITAANLISRAVNNRGSNAEGCQSPCELRFGQRQVIGPRTVLAVG
jgi:hypothetical protein